jgi:predicted permease
MLGTGASSFAATKGNPQNRREVSINYVAPRYFETYATPLLSGRDFSFTDEHGPLVAIINEAMARDFFGGADPIGHYLVLEHVTGRGSDTPTYEIVGIVGDAKYNDLQQPAPRTIYLHAFQESRVVLQLTLRTAVNPESVTSAVGERVASLLKTVPIVRITTMTDQIDAAIVPQRLIARLSSCFGALAALLASIGLYGLLAYTVSRRTNEIGVRMALGATTGNVMHMVLAEAFVMVGIGLALGAPLSLWAKQLAIKLTPELTVNGPVWILCGAIGILAVTMLAAFLPARRAMRVDPMVALRCE